MTSEYQGKLMTQVAEADHFQLLVAGVGLAWDYYRVLWPPCVLAAWGMLRTKAQILKFTLIVQGSSKLLGVM